MTREIVHQDTDGWYFWEKNWAVRQGPFETEEEAEEACAEYCKTVYD